VLERFHKETKPSPNKESSKQLEDTFKQLEEEAFKQLKSTPEQCGSKDEQPCVHCRQRDIKLQQLQVENDILLVDLKAKRGALIIIQSAI
jgi:hypothetical protein